jgi:hypothetical protein
MLMVTIELVPGGLWPMRRTIASMRISNASELAEVSDYTVEAIEDTNPLTGDPPRNASVYRKLKPGGRFCYPINPDKVFGTHRARQRK